MSKVEQILADIKELKLLEVAELVKMMEEEFGVSAAAPVAVATPCCPAPVSAMTRVFHIFFARSTCPSTLLILCAPVWLRSSLFK